MSRKPEVSLEQRQVEYAAAEHIAVLFSEIELTARAGGWYSDLLRDEVAEKQRRLLSAKRRLEQTERRLAKRALSLSGGSENHGR